MTIDDFKRPNARLLTYPILSRNLVDFDNSLSFHKQPRTYVSKVQSVLESRNRSVLLEPNLSMQTRAPPAEMIALELQETGAPLTFVGGKGAAIPSLSVSAQLIP